VNASVRCWLEWSGSEDAFAPLGAGLHEGESHYLLEARQMQAMSFAVHIPLVARELAGHRWALATME